MTSLTPACPDCGAQLGPGPHARCPECRLPLSGPDAAALWQVTMAMQALDEQRSALSRHRGVLLAGLRARRDLPDAEPAPATAPAAFQVASQALPREVSGRSAQTALLLLGGLLVSVAALVFTVVSWGHLGIGGRTAVLLALTVCALVLPRPLRRRRLTATAETSGAVALGLVLLDAYAARAAGLAGLGTVNASGYWAVVLTLVGFGAPAYGWALRMRFPLGAGFLLARVPPLLVLSALGVDRVEAYAAAVVGAVAVDCGLLWSVERAVAGSDVAVRDRLGGLPLQRAAAGFAAAWAVLGGGIAAAGSLAGSQPADVAWSWVPLGALAVLGLAVSVRFPGLPDVPRRLAAAGAGAALLTAAGGTLRLLFAPAWTPVAYGAPAALLLVVAAAFLRRGTRQPAAPMGVFWTAALALSLTSLAAAPELVRAVLEPLGRVPATWAGLPAADWTWQVAPAAVVGLGLLAAALAGVMVLGVTVVPAASLEAASATAAVPALVLLPVALGLPYAVAVAAAVLLAAVGAVAAALRPPRPGVRAVLAVAPVLALLWAAADRTASIGTLSVCAVLGAVLTWRTVAASAPVPHAVAPVAAASSVLALGAEAAAVGTTAGLALPAAMLGVLAVAVGSVPVAAVLARSGSSSPATVSRAVEGAGYVLAAVALILTLPYPGNLAFALAVSGVAALGVALRADRRTAATGTAAVLLISSSWVRLALWEVHTPEAYTLTVAAAALTIGQLRHRRDPAASSWTTYGPGLSVGLLPSLLAVWTDGHWVRPLLLGAAALTVTVSGVRFRLQAPLLLGGTVLLLTALHELAPTVVQVLGLLPRWVPLATAGLLLLVLGATYEQRLRDARRLREGLRRLR